MFIETYKKDGTSNGYINSDKLEYIQVIDGEVFGCFDPQRSKMNLGKAADLNKIIMALNGGNK